MQPSRSNSQILSQSVLVRVVKLDRRRPVPREAPARLSRTASVLWPDAHGQC